MEHRHREGADPALHDHEAHLADRGVDEGLLDVVLNQHRGGADDRGDQTDHEHHVQGRGAERVERCEAREQETAAVDDPRVEQAADRRRREERVGQPQVQRELGRLAHGPDEDQERDRGRSAQGGEAQVDQRIVGSCNLEELRQLERAEELVSQGDAGQEGDVTEAQGQEDPERALGSRAVVVVVGQERQEPAQELPADDERDQVGACDHDQQRSDAQGQERVEARLGCVLLEVTRRVAVEQRPDAGDQDHHHRRQAVDGEHDLGQERPRRAEQLEPDRRGVADQLGQDGNGRSQADHETPPGLAVGLIADPAGSGGDEGRHEGSEGHQECEYLEHGRVHRVVSRFSPRLRRSQGTGGRDPKNIRCEIRELGFVGRNPLGCEGPWREPIDDDCSGRRLVDRSSSRAGRTSPSSHSLDRAQQPPRAEASGLELSACTVWGYLSIFGGGADPLASDQSPV